MEINKPGYIQFYVQDELHTINTSDIKPETTLNSYLRNMSLTGTKYMCYEGGCGACIVGATFKHPVTKENVSVAVNSCLIPVIICQSWKIATIEGIGNKNMGYHPIQKTLADFNGTQCGFCSSGMVMNMYMLKQGNKNLTMKEMENSFGGNLCRCTGYRPIMSAFKTFCKDGEQAEDIEDLPKACPNKSENCEKTCTKPCANYNKITCFETSEKSKWYKVFSLDEIFIVWNMNPTSSYTLICGNTAQGVYRSKEPYDVYIDITSVPDLMKYNLTDVKLTVGANMSLNSVKALFKDVAAKKSKFKYLSKLADHIDLVATIPVRNIGSIAGNLSIKHAHNEFPSDIFLLLTAVNAELTIVGPNKSADEQSFLDYLSSFVYTSEGSEATVKVEDFLQYNMDKKIITKISFFPYDDNYKFESYKIMKRAQNAHAMLNAAFLLKLDKTKVDSARIVYGNINPTFIRAKQTEKLLVGKNLFDNKNLQLVYKTLYDEINPNEMPPEPPATFRKNLSVSLFYKYVLSICPPKLLSDKNKSGGSKLSRPVSSGKQEFKPDTSRYPLGKPLQKLEALAQTSGKAEYINDIPDKPNQLYGAFVLIQAGANSKITSVDTSQALKLPGVVGFFDKASIPGKNLFTVFECGQPVEETLFCKGVVEYFDQPLGIIVAHSEETARMAANLVTIKFDEGAKPLLTVKDVLGASDDVKKERIKVLHEIKPEKKGNDIKQVLKGEVTLGPQYHFHMETQICNAIPTEDGLDLFASTQWMDVCQAAAAQALNIPSSKITVFVRRLGGAFGAKISRHTMVSTACAIAAYKLQKPVKINLTFSENVRMFGGRNPYYLEYEVGVNDEGVIQYMNANYYHDYGLSGNDIVDSVCWPQFTGRYNNDPWHLTASFVKTDNPGRSWARAPGTPEGNCGIEAIIEHIAMKTGRSSNDVRKANYNSEMQDIIKLTDKFSDWANIKKRLNDIEDFNKKNRWMKKALSILPSVFTSGYYGIYGVLVAISHFDGTVAVSHGGIEMGQGINTKVAQACAYALRIPIEKVFIKPSNSIIGVNSIMSGGSITSETVSYAVTEACKKLNVRIDEVRKTLKKGTPWVEVIQTCYTKDVDLREIAIFSIKESKIETYSIFGVGATEIVLDILTGNFMANRTDIIQDTGHSLNPDIDIGQIEGAYVMGLGYHTCEEIKQDSKGRVLTDRTWTYKVPGVKDIPVDFRVKLPDPNPNPGQAGVLNTKGIAEPPFLFSLTVPIALRYAMASARQDADGNAEKWVPIDGPTTVNFTHEHCLNKFSDYTL